jgi:hypothetical protein
MQVADLHRRSVVGDPPPAAAVRSERAKRDDWRAAKVRQRLIERLRSAMRDAQAPGDAVANVRRPHRELLTVRDALSATRRRGNGGIVMVNADVTGADHAAPAAPPSRVRHTARGEHARDPPSAAAYRAPAPSGPPADRRVAA